MRFIYDAGPIPGADVLRDLLRDASKQGPRLLFGHLPAGIEPDLPNASRVVGYLSSLIEWIDKEIIMGGGGVLPWDHPRIGKSNHTTGVVHTNYKGAFHRDHGNIPGSLTAAIVVREPGSTGGAFEIRWPEGGSTSYPMPHGSLVIFDGLECEHSVTPTQGGNRYSVVVNTRVGLAEIK